MRTLSDPTDHIIEQWPALQTVIVQTRDYTDWNKIIYVELNPGEEWEQAHGHETDEGYKSMHESIAYTISGWIVKECDTSETDCDGPHESHWLGRIMWDDLDAKGAPVTNRGWITDEFGQRDIYAEQMGY